MGKVILEFDSIEDQDDIRTALDGAKWKSAMWDLDQELRRITKYDVSLINPNQQADETEYKVADRMREIIRGILDDHNLKLD